MSTGRFRRVRVRALDLLLAAGALLAPVLTAYGPEALDLASRRAAPSLAHWFGTDDSQGSMAASW